MAAPRRTWFSALSNTLDHALDRIKVLDKEAA
eukprot:SAG22_NODE_2183_length_2874_cov_1.789550_2_plen_32_part_00